jgi:hypothetical protein
MTFLFTPPEDAPLELTRHESLNEYLTAPLPNVTPRTRAEYDAMPEAERAGYDRARIAMLSGGITLSTRSLQECKKALIRTFVANSARTSGHVGVLCTGPSTAGKTTTAKALMRWTLEQYAKQFPQWRAADHIPVVYVEVPANANGKTLMKQFLHFLGLSVGTRETADDLRLRVVAALRRANTQLVCVDELHNLQGRRAGVSEASDILKGLSNDLRATFLYAGIDLTTSSLMSGPRGQQLAGRFTAVELSRYEWANVQHRTEWKGLVKAFERRLALLDHPAGSLSGHVEYLHQRTSGSLGALARLLTGTALDLILGDGPEHITREVLDAYTLDHTSEQLYRRRDLPKTHVKKRPRKPAPPVDETVAAIDAAQRAFLDKASE